MNSTGAPVVVGITDKQPSVLGWAMREARAAGVGLQVVHAYGLPAQATCAFAGVDMMPQLRSAAERVLADAKELIDREAPALPVEYFLSSAPPLEALMQVSTRARELVLGADDVPWFDRIFRSRIAGYLARHAESPVVVVPDVSYPAAPSGGIVLTLDGATSAAGPLRYAFDQASARHDVLHVLHATPPATLASDAEAIRANIGEVLCGWREQFPDVVVETAFLPEEAKDAIAGATRTADLVIVGRPHGHTVPFAISRPTAVDVLRRANCPVAVVPSDYRGA